MTEKSENTRKTEPTTSNSLYATDSSTLEQRLGSVEPGGFLAIDPSERLNVGTITNPLADEARLYLAAEKTYLSALEMMNAIVEAIPDELRGYQIGDIIEHRDSRSFVLKAVPLGFNAKGELLLRLYCRNILKDGKPGAVKIIDSQYNRFPIKKTGEKYKALREYSDAVLFHGVK